MPWHHLIMQHDNLKKALFKSEYGNDNEKNYMWGEYKKLNKISAVQLVLKFEKFGFTVLNKKINYVNSISPPLSC